MKYILPKSGYTLELKDFLNNKIFREYQKILTKDVEIKGSSQDVNIRMDKIYEAQDYVLERTIVSLTSAEGVAFEKPFDVIMELGVEDGNFVYGKIQELIGGSTMSEDVKKNG